MAVEYIDSPNAGFIKLGEGVDLSTITPQQKRKIKRGDRGIFPITPTGAESYEGPDFKAQEAFSTPASAIPNVFDRYRTLPGGARAGGFPGGSFENVISPGTGNQNDDANDDDEDLEEELRRQSLDIDPVGDYDLSRFDPSSPNYDVQATSDRVISDIVRGGNFFDSLDLISGGQDFTSTQGLGNLATLGANVENKLNSDKERLMTLIEKTPEGRVKTFFESELEALNNTIANNKDILAAIGGRGSAPELPVLSSIRNQVEQNRMQQGQLGGTGVAKASTAIPKVGFDELSDSFNLGGTGTTLDAISGLGSAPTGVPSFSGSVGRSGMFGLPDVRSDIGETPPSFGFSPAPGVGGSPQPAAPPVEFDPGDFDMGGLGADIEAAGEASGLGADFDFGAALGFQPSKDGGKISFMNIKK